MPTTTEAEQRAAVVAEARSWISTRWEHSARVKGAGVDCAMFLAEVFERTGALPHIPTPPYPPDAHLHRDAEQLLELVEQHATRRPAGEKPLPGDIALFRYFRALSHAAIVLEYPLIIHAQLRAGVILDDLEANADLAGRLAGFWSPWR